MKRFARFIPQFALALVLVITALTLRSRSAWRGWQSLPSGGEVRLLGVTHGTAHSIEHPGPTWRDRVRKAWQTRSLRPLAPQPGFPMRTATKTPSLVFWVEGRNLPGAGRSPRALRPNADLVLADRQAFEGVVGFAGRSPTTAQWEVQFPVLPARSKRLRLITRWKGAQREFVAPNPAYRTDLPVWKAGPLPQTKRHGDAAFTLRGMNVVAMKSGQGGDALREEAKRVSMNVIAPKSAQGGTEALLLWRAQPLWTITHRARRGDSFYQVDTIFEDSAGNVSHDIALFSERVWKVRATITRTALFPFADSEVRWVCTIDPALAEAQAPQTYALLPLTAERSAGRFKLVGVFGTGRFEIRLGAVTAIASLNADEAQRGTEWDPTRGIHIVRLGQPAVIIVEDRSAVHDADFEIFRDEEGSAAPPRERWGGTPNRWSLRVFDLPAKPVRLGLANPDPFALEFLIAAPKMPGVISG